MQGDGSARAGGGPARQVVVAACCKGCLIQETKIGDQAAQAAQAAGSRLPKRQRPPIEAANLEAWDCDLL